MMVKLDAEAVAVATRVGTTRKVNADHRGWVSKFEGPEARHVFSAIGERAMFKFLGIDSGPDWERWLASATRPDYEGDVGDVEVRTVPRRRGRLVIRPGDHDERPYVLTRVLPPPPGRTDQWVELVGWVYGREGQLDDYWCDGGRWPDRPFWIVPNDKLRPIRTLSEAVDADGHLIREPTAL